MANTDPGRPEYDEIAFQDQVAAFHAEIDRKLAFLEDLLRRVEAGEFGDGPEETPAGLTTDGRETE